AIIGISGFGTYHYMDLMYYHKKKVLNLISATVINQKEEEKKCNELRAIQCKLYTNYNEMLTENKGKIDICFIPTGIHLHKEMTIQALRSNTNVFVEKPAAPTIQDVLEMEKVQSTAERFVAVGFQHTYNPEFLKIKNLILDGKIGNIKTIKCFAMWPRTESYYKRNNWAGKLKLNEQWVLDSPFNNALSHQLNQICFFAGENILSSAEIKSVQAETYRANNIESPDTVCMRIITKKDLPIYFFATHACLEKIDPEIHIIGNKGKIIWRITETQIEIDGKRTVLFNPSFENTRRYMIESLIKRIYDQTVFICTLDIAKIQTICANAAHESSKIIQIPRQFISRKSQNGISHIFINNIEKIITRSFEKEMLFSELGIDWAVEGKIINLNNYIFFPSYSDL
ncbi:MAG TPA: Gfo/Idh/MocA family oxidoreductase, partial [Victivallales bacterium]|nr:Gfo/Idh/MocA family oxidoreductase [Victivallales bacterium]